MDNSQNKKKKGLFGKQSLFVKFELNQTIQRV